MRGKAFVSEDYRDKIQEIRARRRGGGQTSSYTPGGGAGGGLPGGGGLSPYDLTPQVGANKVGPSLGINIASNTPTTESILGPDFKSPWLRDRVTLSLEGQIAMMELRSGTKVSNVDLGYQNRIPILPIRPGIYVRVEPPGTYRLCYHYR
jgi:hypothetical protein